MIKYLKLITIILITFIPRQTIAQEIYVVEGDTVYLYNNVETMTMKKILGIIPNGTVVEVIDKINDSFWKVRFYGNEGFVSTEFLLLPEHSKKYSGWLKDKFISGTNPDCENINEQFNDSLDNELKIHVGKRANVVVKLMNESEECIRIVYIKRGDTYSVVHIPEGTYYLKLAYGKDLRKFVENGDCKIKFLLDPVYKIGTNKLNFNIIKKPDSIANGYVYKNWEIPSFELFLDIDYRQMKLSDFNSNTISEEEFNK
ncbi:MAG: SH3 domain-containing protein [Bacteroidota bacterium]